jgi:plastocyanin domain-containing protein
LKRKEAVAMAEGSIDILVEGGYNPETIEIPVNKQTILNFTRKDSNPCLEEIVLGDFKIKKPLPLNETVSIALTPKKKGTFQFSCGMGMFHGKIVVRG